MDTGAKKPISSLPATDFSKILGSLEDPQQRCSLASDTGEFSPSRRINLDENNVKNSLGQLVLALVKLLHELLERQAIQRMESGSLNDAEIEKLGLTLMRQAQEIDQLRKSFGLEETDLNLDLGPLGKLF